MMVRRDKSGRSGRRRGSQKLGTAIRLVGFLAAGAGVLTNGRLDGCASAPAMPAASMAARMNAAPPRMHCPPFQFIRPPR